MGDPAPPTTERPVVVLAVDPVRRPADIDRERIGMTTRSALANLDALGEDGMTARQHNIVVNRATALLRAEERLPDAEVALLAAELRDILAHLPGPTSAVLRLWLDDALGRPDRAWTR